jgi:conjugative transposon TraN protein
MKKLFLIITCFISLHVFAQDTRKSDLPTVYLPLDLSVHFVSPEPIQYVDISTKSIVGDLPLKNVLRIRYKDSVKFGKDAVVTIAGEKFIAQYHVVFSPPDGGAIRTNIEVLPADMKPLETSAGLSQPELKDYALHLLSKKPEKNEHAEAFGLVATLNHVYTFGDYIFLDIGFENSTKLAYDIDEIRFRLDDQKVVKATTVQSMEVKPILTLFDLTGFKKYYRNIFVFKKFSYPGNKVLDIELSEKQLSGRVISLKIPYKDILNADIIPPR